MKREELTKTFINDDFKLKKTFGLNGLYTNILALYRKGKHTLSTQSSYAKLMYLVASELNDPICHSNECQIGSFSSEATICWMNINHVIFKTSIVAATPFCSEPEAKVKVEAYK